MQLKYKDAERKNNCHSEIIGFNWEKKQVVDAIKLKDKDYGRKTNFHPETIGFSW